jgi:phosphoesterase RecJ-like protein
VLGQDGAGHTEPVAQLADHFLRAQHILLTTHTTPDGDGIGGSLGLAQILRSLGKNVTVYLQDPVPYNLRFLPGADTITHQVPDGASFDLTCSLDAPNLAALGSKLPARPTLGLFVSIDHHRRAEPFADLTWNRPDSASVGELVYQLAQTLGVEVTRDIATCLYCAIFCDTGGFRYSRTNPHAMRVAAELLERGVDPWEITVHIQESHPASRNLLLGEVLRTLTLSPDGRCAAITITREMFERTGGSEALTDGFINFARGIEGVEVAIQLIEVDDESYRIGFRSRGRVDVSQVAGLLGGGGKKNAAGCQLCGTHGEILSRVFSAVAQVVA